MGLDAAVVAGQRRNASAALSLIAYVNGDFKPLEHATVHIEDRGFQFADGIYEVVACYNGRFFELQPHLERLERSCQAIELLLPMPLAELASLIQETYRRNLLDDAMIYVQITRGVAPRVHVPAADLTPSLIITARPLPEVEDEKLLYGVAAITLPDIRWRRCDIKSIALLASVMGKHEAVHHGAAEAFWLDEAGCVLEGCSTNAFAVIDGVLVTQPLSERILGGITRDLVLHLAREDGMDVRERPWRLDESGLSECMMSSTTNGILSVVRVDGHDIGGGKPGAVASHLRALLLARIAAATKA